MIKFNVQSFIEKSKNNKSTSKESENKNIVLIWEEVFAFFKKISSFAIRDYRRKQYFEKKKIIKTKA